MKSFSNQGTSSDQFRSDPASEDRQGGRNNDDGGVFQNRGSAAGRSLVPVPTPQSDVNNQFKVSVQTVDTNEIGIDDGGAESAGLSRSRERYSVRNDDGSITWGYSNLDGTFKEETIGINCITRGR